jgi:segregation and condensation protein B
MELKSILEAILFSAQHPLTPKDLRELLASAAEKSEESAPKEFRKVSTDQITEALEQLTREQEEIGRTYRLMCVAGSWQFATRPDYAPWIKALVGHKVRPPRLSQPALETLAIIAYRQPLTRAEIEQIRGVAVDGVMQNLLERGLVEQTGRAEVPGRPNTYGTTPQFLEYFGLGSLEDLPAADELRRIPIQKPETLLTADHPGLATAPPEGTTTEPEAAAPAETNRVENEPAPPHPA